MFIQRATAHTAQADPEKKKENDGIGCLFPNPSPDPGERNDLLLSSSELSQPRVRPHIDGMWLAYGMKSCSTRPKHGRPKSI